jgi:hypothetical protein
VTPIAPGLRFWRSASSTLHRDEESFLQADLATLQMNEEEDIVSDQSLEGEHFDREEIGSGCKLWHVNWFEFFDYTGSCI